MRAPGYIPHCRVRLMCNDMCMATHRGNKYSTAHFASDGRYVQLDHSSKARALKAAATLPGLVRVATPAGNLVTYVDNRKRVAA